jgi:hypothetical protein
LGTVFHDQEWDDLSHLLNITTSTTYKTGGFRGLIKAITAISRRRIVFVWYNYEIRY